MLLITGYEKNVHNFLNYISLTIKSLRVKREKKKRKSQPSASWLRKTKT